MPYIRYPKYLEDKLHRFEEDLMSEDAFSIRTDLEFGIGDLPRGPEPGPVMPKKKRLQIV
jgi:hypothetical protein